MLKTFEDGNRYIVEEIKGIQILNLKLGFNLNFIDKLVLVDGTIVQNMQYEIPTPKELLKRLKEQ